MLELLVAAAFLAAPAGAMGRRPRGPGLGEIQARERVADRKMRLQDRGAVEEYRAVIDLAESASAAATAPLAEALLVFESELVPAEGPGAKWRRATLQVLTGLTPEERAYVRELIGEMTSARREVIMERQASAGARDGLLARLPGSIREWRELRTILARMQVNCGGECR